MNIPECSTIGRNLGLPTIDNICAALRNLSIKSVRSDDILWKENKKIDTKYIERISVLNTSYAEKQSKPIIWHLFFLQRIFSNI